MRSTDVLHAGQYPLTKTVSRIGAYALSMAVVPTLVVAGPMPASLRAEEIKANRPSSAVSPAGSQIDWRLFLAQSALRRADFEDFDFSQVTLTRAPSKIRKLRARVVKRERVSHIPESPQELDAWLGAVDA